MVFVICLLGKFLLEYFTFLESVGDRTDFIVTIALDDEGELDVEMLYAGGDFLYVLNFAVYSNNFYGRVVDSKFKKGC